MATGPWSYKHSLAAVCLPGGFVLAALPLSSRRTWSIILAVALSSNLVGNLPRAPHISQGSTRATIVGRGARGAMTGNATTTSDKTDLQPQRHREPHVTDNSQPPGDQSKSIARLGQFVAWTLGAAFGFGMVEVVAFAIFGDPWIGLAGAVTLGYGGCLLVARGQFRRGRIEAGVMTSSVGLLVGIVLVAPVLPIAIPALAILPLVVVAFALPYIRGREMRLLILACWAVGIFVAYLGAVLTRSQLPAWFSITFRISSIGAALGLAFLLLWQFTSRLNDTLVQILAANTELQMMQTRLETQNERLALTLRSIQEGVITTDPAGKVVSLNDAAGALTGWAEAQALGQPFSDIVHMANEASGKHDENPVADVLRTGVAQELPDRTVLVARDGTRRSIAGNCSPIHGESGHIHGMVLVFRDITERKRTEQALRHSEQKFSILFDKSAFTATLSRLPDGVIVDVNEAFERAFGYTKQEAAGKTSLELGINPDSEGRVRILAALKEHGSARNQELALQTKSGEVRIFSVNVDLIEIGDQKYVLNTTQDITERKRAEEELKRMAAELARSNADLEQFASVASHDLQEPLRMVASYVQLLAKRYKGKLDSDADEYITYAVDGANRMRRLIHDLLAYSRVGTRGKPFGPANGEAVFDQALANLKVAIKESGAVVTHDPLPTVLADTTQLVQVFQNLVGNALKFHGAEPPRVHVSTRREASEWVFSIRDNGLGIDPQYARRVFEIFQRLHRQDEYPGTGIGLAICKKIVERHGGRLWLESQPGAGSTFYFTIPIERNPVL